MRLLVLISILCSFPALARENSDVYTTSNIITVNAAAADSDRERNLDLEAYQHWSGNSALSVRFGTFVARTPDDWKKLWGIIGSEAPGRFPPDKIAVGIMLGSRLTDGYNVRVTSMRQAGGGLMVVYLETKPASPEGARKTPTSPWVVMLAPKTDGSVRFIPQSMAGY